jgi:hypothetical protein
MLSRSGALFAAIIGAVLAIAVTPLNAQDKPERPEIVPRAAWGAKPANGALMSKQSPHAIVVHHTSSRRQPKLSLEKKLQGLQNFSQSPGKVGSRDKPAWGDLPYHFYIDVSGRIGEGRDLSFSGDTNTDYDAGDKIQIVVEGNFEREEPSAGQRESLTRLVVWLAAEHGIAADKIDGHNDFAATDCPGKTLKAMLPELRNRVSGAARWP